MTPGADVVRWGLRLAKAAGLFRLARRLTRGGLRIVCYHGFAVADEHRYRGRLFVTAELFRRRLQFLARNKYPILPLDQACASLKAGTLPPCATVITIDDGWEGVHSKALPIIKEMGIPATVYATTWYIEHRLPVFSVTLSYLFWRTGLGKAELPRGLGTYDLRHDRAAADAACQRYGTPLAPSERLAFTREVAAALQVPFEEIERRRLFLLLTRDQARELAAAGVDIQLHTHRHQWSLDDKAKAAQEIEENRRFLAPLTTRPLEHFCYPSGIYSPAQAPWLAELGIKTATTLEPGLNHPGTSAYGLRRLVDGEMVSEIEFDAEMSGFMELLRAVRGKTLTATLGQLRAARRGSARAAPVVPAVGNGREEDAAFYDRLHAETDTSEVQHLYRPLLRQVMAEIRTRGAQSVLEVGCGNGFLAKEILDLGSIEYRGFDFSPVAVATAGNRTGRPDAFYIGDACSPDTYAGVPYDTIVCTEVLEHIEADLDAVAHWRAGTWCVCSVPNFDYDGHVRFFRSASDVVKRYHPLIDISVVKRISRPLVPDGSVAEYVRRLRWNRNNPQRLMGYVGIGSFEALGGWFLFAGMRR